MTWHFQSTLAPLFKDCCVCSFIENIVVGMILTASAWLLPPLSRVGVGKMDPSWHSCTGRCWSGGEGFAKAWEIGESWSITKCDNIGELQLENISVERRLGMAQRTDSSGVTCIGFGRGETEKWGIKWTRSCWFRKKTPLYTEKPNDPMEYVATVQGSAA